VQCRQPGERANPPNGGDRDAVRMVAARRPRSASAPRAARRTAVLNSAPSRLYASE
jgi:hypothetical protein